jgi:UDP-N-acetyl-D-mannosaminuronic acid transferase (WecB/TagA/CpsF family)
VQKWRSHAQKAVVLAVGLMALLALFDVISKAFEANKKLTPLAMRKLNMQGVWFLTLIFHYPIFAPRIDMMKFAY